MNKIQELNPAINIQRRIKGAFLGLACGDALGAPAEFKSKSDVQRKWGTLKDMVGGGPWLPGEWTDDAAMALGIARGILQNPDDPVPVAGQEFLKWSKHAKDVGATISAALHNFSGDWAVASQNTHQAKMGKAAGNGSLMRTLPVALTYANETQMLRQSARLSAMTHWDAQAEVCCAIYCLWISYLLQGKSRQEAWHTTLSAREHIVKNGKLAPDRIGPTPLPEGFWSRLKEIETLEYSQLQPSGYAGYAVECLEAAVWCVLHTDSLEECLVKVVNLAGESDTMAAVAGGAAGAYWGEEAIPARWLDKLHQREELEQVASDLCDLREHLAVYATPGLPSFEYSQINEQLYAGRNPLTAWDVKQLAALGITHILDLREPREWKAVDRLGKDAVEVIARNGMVRANLVVQDMGAPNDKTIGAACQFIDGALRQKATKVYIHCRAGMERTAAILIAYHARQHGASYEEALQTLRRARPILRPLPDQESAIRKWLGSLPEV
jgi:ADP-ribosyl-[dinitrogen reductase] hydrolase